MFRVWSQLAVVILAFIIILQTYCGPVAEGWSFLNHHSRRETEASKIIHSSYLYNRKDMVSTLARTTETAAVVVVVISTGIGCSYPADASEEEVEPSVVAQQLSESDEEERQQRQEELKQRILERRKLMEASRSSNNRQSYLDLSRQRAVLYNTTFKGVTCPPNVPCL